MTTTTKEIKRATKGIKRTIMVLDSETIGFGIHKGNRLMAVKYNEDTKKIDTKNYNPYLTGGFVNLTQSEKVQFEGWVFCQLGINLTFLDYTFGGKFEIDNIERIAEVEKFFNDYGWNVSKKDTFSVWKKLESADLKDREKKHKADVMLTIEQEGYTMKYEKLCYDIGYTVARYNAKTKKMDVLRERSYLVREVFLNMKVMEKAYFFAKHPEYLEMLGNGEITIKPFQEILDIMEEDVQEFGINTFSNYNAGFDTNALKDTIEILGCTKPSNFKVMLEDVWCIWNMACQVLYQRPSYVKMALENGWISDSGKFLKTNAEVGYSYMTKDADFIEDHTALSDARIETELLGYILRQGQKVDKGINSACWRTASVKKYCNVNELAIGRLSKDEIKGILKKN